MDRNDKQTDASGKGERSSRSEDTEIVLGMLSAIEQNQHVTQRSLSGELGIALGLANSYLKRLVRKGFVKVQQAPINRYAYYLTPKGFIEKARLTTEYLSVSLTFFRQARRECSELLALCDRRGWRRVLLAGAGELAEIATLCSTEAVEVVAVLDPGRAGERCGGLRVIADLAAAGPVDAILVTELSHPQATFDTLTSQFAPDRVLAPALLRIVERAEAPEATGDATAETTAEAELPDGRPKEPAAEPADEPADGPTGERPGPQALAGE